VFRPLEGQVQIATFATLLAESASPQLCHQLPPRKLSIQRIMRYGNTRMPATRRRPAKSLNIHIRWSSTNVTIADPARRKPMWGDLLAFPQVRLPLKQIEHRKKEDCRLPELVLIRASGD